MITLVTLVFKHTLFTTAVFFQKLVIIMYFFNHIPLAEIIQTNIVIHN